MNQVNAIRHGHILEQNDSPVASELIRNAATAELLTLGYLLSPSALADFSVKQLEELLAGARTVSGADRPYVSMYPGFPKQVQESSTLTLLVDQIKHYLSNGTVKPLLANEPREALSLIEAITSSAPLRLITAKEAATQLMQNRVALSENDLAYLADLVTTLTKSDIEALLTGSKNNENTGSLIRALKNHEDIHDLVATTLKSARSNDVLLRVILNAYSEPSYNTRVDDHARLLTALTNSDSTSFRMSAIPYPIRVILVNKLGQVTEGFKADSLLQRRNIWQRVNKALHGYTITNNAQTQRALDIIHENIAHVTLNAHIEKAIEQKDATAALKYLEHRPAELLQRLVKLLSFTDNANEISAALSKLEGRFTLTKLISAYNGVISANYLGAKTTRVAGRKNIQLTNNRDEIPVESIQIVRDAISRLIVTELKTRKAPVGEVSIDNTSPITLMRRDASTTSRNVERGERITPVGEGDTIRFFVQWFNTGSRVDLDLSANVYDKNMKALESVTWDTYKGSREYAVYSGDITNAPRPQGAAEFIDINQEKLLLALPSARYIGMGVISYNGQPLMKVDHHAGVMYRGEPEAGEIFDARTVVNGFTSESDSSAVAPLVLDLETGEAIWIDTDTGSSRGGYSASGDSALAAAVKDEILRPRLTIGELAGYWAQAHNAPTNNLHANQQEILALL